jgi:hypothetical protein
LHGTKNLLFYVSLHRFPSLAAEGVKKSESVMLSAAKHLHYLENKRMQILRSAQDDNAG